MRQAGLGSLTAVVDAAFANLRRHIPPGSVQAYAFALACTFGATLFEVCLLWVDPQASLLSGYYPAVALTALVAGIAPGAMVAVAGVLIAWWGLMAPIHSFSLERHHDVMTLITFAFLSLLIVYAADYFRRLAKRLEDEEYLRQLAVRELAHRLKNKVATIQAIISVQLRDQPQVRSDILSRLQALTADRPADRRRQRSRCLHARYRRDRARSVRCVARVDRWSQRSKPKGRRSSTTAASASSCSRCCCALPPLRRALRFR
jgi:K+-sensing histidine kinase KdpD